MKIKRVLAIFVAATILIIGISLFISVGFKKRTDVFLQDYAISEDGSVMTVKTSLWGSMGYIRAIETERDGDAVYCSFYRTFGGLNSGIGAKNQFEIELDHTSAKIYFDRGESGNALVLQKDKTTGTWVRVIE